jgi:hypothetical protein
MTTIVVSINSAVFTRRTPLEEWGHFTHPFPKRGRTHSNPLAKPIGCGNETVPLPDFICPGSTIVTARYRAVRPFRYQLAPQVITIPATRNLSEGILTQP